MSTGKFKVRIYSHARSDMEDIIEYINTLSPQAAVKYYEHIIEKMNCLSEMPERYPLSRDYVLRSKGYRCMPIDNYLVFYVVRETPFRFAASFMGSETMSN